MLFGKDRWIRSIRALVVVLALFVAGCDQATGGGWIPSASDADRANFGFTVKCRNTEQNGEVVALLYEGQLEWHDGVVRFHGDVEPFEFLVFEGARCEDLDEFNFGVVLFNGTYRPQRGGMSGNFAAVVSDLGEPGKMLGDAIIIQLQDGEYDTYSNAGMIQGGNIQIR